ncbi:putative gustatory receptor 2a [Trichogramma pretiosum]|uniref:putative gustatory receptor 2a n=1 Tax=Trichogramma pretiosum TaxID=7493 RepID=UPI0006C9A20B|nr:putative gustatory receptor 2a [Trichogramma pretiosum]
MRSQERVRKESALYEVVCPAVYVSRAMGLAPYELTARGQLDGQARLAPSRLNCLYSLFWTSLYSYIVVTSLMRFAGSKRDKPVLGVTETGKLLLNYAVSLVELSLCVLRRAEFAGVWNAIQAFDEAYDIGLDNNKGGGDRDQQQQQHHPLLRQAKHWLWLLLFGFVLAWVSVNQTGMYAFNESYVNNIGYMLTYVGTCVAVLKFCGMAALLLQRFRHLNQLLQAKLDTNVNDSKVDYARETEDVDRIETSYNYLLAIGERLNEIYSLPLFLYLLNLFAHAVSNMYYFSIWTIVDRDYVSQPRVLLCLVAWLVVYFGQMCLIHIACHFVSAEANKMPIVLLDWRRRDITSNEYRSTLHYLNRKMRFNAAGCFYVNLQLLTSTFGHLTTYLVILLQIPSEGSE